MASGDGKPSLFYFWKQLEEKCKKRSGEYAKMD